MQTATLFVTRSSIGSELFERVDLDLEKVLPVPVPLVVPALLLVFDHQDLGRAADLDDGAFYLCLGDVGSADSRVFAVINKKNLVKNDGVAFFVLAIKLLNGNDIAL